MNSSLNTSGQTSADCNDGVDIHQARGFQVGLGPSVDERSAVARHPPDQTLSVAHR